ncbi:hypothetical protein TELCIR_20822, partial [Teladorsagia circumcincta]
ITPLALKQIHQWRQVIVSTSSSANSLSVCITKDEMNYALFVFFAILAAMEAAPGQPTTPSPLKHEPRITKRKPLIRLSNRSVWVLVRCLGERAQTGTKFKKPSNLDIVAQFN